VQSVVIRHFGGTYLYPLRLKSVKQETSVQQVARQNKSSTGIPVMEGLERKGEGIVPALIGSLLVLVHVWLTGRTNGKLHSVGVCKYRTVEACARGRREERGRAGLGRQV
jgi:hypothetical protein